MKIQMNRSPDSEAFILVIGKGEMFIEMTLPYNGEDQIKFLTSIHDDIVKGIFNERCEETEEAGKETKEIGAEGSESGQPASEEKTN